MTSGFSSFACLPHPTLSRDGTTPARPFPQSKVANVIVDSRDRDFTKYASSSNFVVNLPEKYYNVRAAVVTDAQIPSSFYVFSSERGTNYMTVYLDATGHLITIPDGNYSSSEMVTALQGALDLAFGASVFTVSFDSNAQKFTFTASGTVSIDTSPWPVGVPYTSWGLPYFLGFPQYTSSIPYGSGSLTSTFMANLNPEPYLLIHVDELDGIDQCSANGRGRKCLAKIPLEGDSYTYTTFDCNSNASYIPQADLHKLTVSLRTHDGNLVNLNGQEWSFTVQLTCTDVRT